MFTICLISSFPIALWAEMMTAALPSSMVGTLKRMVVVPSAAVLPLKMTRGGSTVEISLTSTAAAAMMC